MNPESMTPIDWAKRPLQKYADFRGRAPRAEFWWFVLFMVIAFVLTHIIESILGLPDLFVTYGPLTLLFWVAIFLPNLAVQVRRLHDSNKSGLWLLGCYVPYVLMMVMSPMLFSGQPASPADFNMGSALIVGLLGLIVFVAGITLLVFYCLAGTPGDNRYGPNPYGEGEGSAVAAE